MSSTHTINFSLRQNKAIERTIAFDALGQAWQCIGPDPVYVGLGSVWFQDFNLAHRSLRITAMVSIENDHDVFVRAEYNKPFKSIEVVEGSTTDVIPDLLDRADLKERAWIVWLDYDSAIDDPRLDELSGLVAELPPGSAILTTFNAMSKNYGGDTDRVLEAVQDLFGDDIVGDRESEDLKGRGLMATLADCVLGHLKSTAIQSGRKGGFVPGVRLLYRDSANMVTVGGFLPDPDRAELCSELVESPEWCGREAEVIETQPLTLREVQALSQLLPSNTGLSQAEVSELGIELSKAQIGFFERHYLRYPTYAEIQ